MTACTKRGESYWTTCACDDCKVLRWRRNKYFKAGKFSRVPAEVAEARVFGWLDDGFEAEWIASACGISPTAIHRAARHHRQGIPWQVGPARSEQIMRADIWSATTGRCPSIGTTRRLQGLAVNGWTLEHIFELTGVPETSLSPVQRGARKRVSASIYHPVRDLFERIGDDVGPSTKGATRAQRRGWWPPAAWDNPDTDPDLEPELGVFSTRIVDDVVIERILAGEHLRANAAEKAEVIRRWTAAGRSLNSLVDQTGWRVHAYIDRDERQAS